MAQIVTITNPLTGQPAQVDQLDHTAQEIDDAIARALPGGEIDITLQQITGATNAAEYSATATYAIGDYCTHDGKLYRCTTAITEPEAWTEAHWTETTVGSELTAIYTALADKPDKNSVVNPNLLDNWYFGNPVNQRGQTEYTGEVYTIDRWIAQWTGYGVTQIEDGCVSIYRTDSESHLVQRIADDLGGQTVTFSALCKGNCGINLIESDSGWAFKSHIANHGDTASNDYTLFTVTGVVPQGCKNLLAELTSAQGVKSQFKAVKLELGSQQTLAHQENGNWVLNEIPDYGEQLARCQRYFQLYSSADIRPAKAVDCRPTMRADPAQGTVVVNGTTYYYNNADL